MQDPIQSQDHQAALVDLDVDIQRSTGHIQTVQPPSWSKNACFKLLITTISPVKLSSNCLKNIIYFFARKHEQDQRRAILKLDLILIPMVVLLYFFSALDRLNIGNARIAGLQSDLKLSDHEFSLALSVTYVTFILVKIPAALALKSIGPCIFLPMISFAWGLVTFFEGFIVNFGGLLTIRLLSGLTEGGLYPAVVLYLSQSYSRDQLQMRIAIFCSSSSLSGTFSGPLAYSILKLDGKLQKPGWAWLFFLEGIATMLFAIILAFSFPGSIDTNRYLSQKDKQILKDRLTQKRPSKLKENEQFRWSEILAALKSPHVLILTITQFMAGITASSIAFFTPTVVQSLGYTTSQAQLMASPPFVVAFPVMLAAAYFSDCYQARALTATICSTIAFVGFLVFGLVEPSYTKVKYASLFLAIPATYSITPCVGAWASNNSCGYYRKAFAIAFTYLTATVGAVASTWLFPHSQAPKYQQGIITNICCCACVSISVILNYIYLRYSTRYKALNRNKILNVYEIVTEKGNIINNELAWKELGDRHPDFKYVY